MQLNRLLVLAICLGQSGHFACSGHPASASQLAGAAQHLSLNYLTNFCFQSLAVRDTNVVFKFRPVGQRFTYSVNQGQRKLSEYGEEVVVPIGVALELMQRHGTITFSTLPEAVKQHGFAVRARDDLRSFGREVIVREAYLIAVPRQAASRDAPEGWDFRCVPPTVEAVQAALALVNPDSSVMTNAPPTSNS